MVLAHSERLSLGEYGMKAAATEFARFLEEQQATSLPHEVVMGDPRARIVEIAERDGYDLIVMGTHGRSGRVRALAGSVAETVVRRAPCAVMTVRAAD
jgi:nucleotide-binding universal stress UspA family protein